MKNNYDLGFVAMINNTYGWVNLAASHLYIFPQR